MMRSSFIILFHIALSGFKDNHMLAIITSTQKIK